MYRQAGDSAGFVCVDRLFHLHRLENDNKVACGDPLSFGDGDLDDGPLHGGGQGIPGHGSGGGPAAALALRHSAGLGSPGDNGGGERDLHALAVDFDGDSLPSGLPASSVWLDAVANPGGKVVTELRLDPPGVHVERPRAAV